MDEDPETTLGDDIAAIRARVLGERAKVKAEHLSPGELAHLGDALRAEVQVDLDHCPGALRGLEDPDLLNHIAAQRAELKAYQEKMKEIPSRGDLNLRYVGAIGAMSELVKGLGAKKLEVDDAAALAHSRAEALASVRTKTTPRNAPPNPFRAIPEGGDEFLRFFEAEAAKTTADFDVTNALVKDCHKEVFKLHRDFTYLVDNLLRRVDALEAENHRMRVIVRDAAEAAKKN